MENTEQAWFDGLETIYSERWKLAEEERNSVVDRRHMNAIAADCCTNALEKVRLDRPIAAGELKPTTAMFSSKFSDRLWSIYRSSPFLRRVKARAPRSLVAAARKLIKRGN